MMQFARENENDRQHRQKHRKKRTLRTLAGIERLRERETGLRRDQMPRDVHSGQNHPDHEPDRKPDDHFRNHDTRKRQHALRQHRRIEIADDRRHHDREAQRQHQARLCRDRRLAERGQRLTRVADLLAARELLDQSSLLVERVELGGGDAYAYGLLAYAYSAREDFQPAEAAFRNAAHIVEIDVQTGRHSGVPLETRGAIGVYDAAKDFLPVIYIATSPNILIVHPSVPATTLAELVALAKKQPEKLAFGSAGNGSVMHVSTQYFLDTAAIKVLHVPYKGTGPALQDTIGGQVQLIFGAIPTTLPHVKAGRLRGLAVTTAKRVSAAPASTDSSCRTTTDQSCTAAARRACAPMAAMPAGSATRPAAWAAKAAVSSKRASRRST